MAYDEDLAARIRDQLSDTPDVTERKMFGGLAFLVRGNMAIAASGQGGVLVRADPARLEELQTRGARMAEMQGRLMPGWLRVDEDAVSDDESLVEWVKVGTSFAGSLPPK